MESQKEKKEIRKRELYGTEKEKKGQKEKKEEI